MPDIFLEVDARPKHAIIIWCKGAKKTHGKQASVY